jgi:hypothetical protein
VQDLARAVGALDVDGWVETIATRGDESIALSAVVRLPLAVCPIL